MVIHDIVQLDARLRVALQTSEQHTATVFGQIIEEPYSLGVTPLLGAREEHLQEHQAQGPDHARLCLVVVALVPFGGRVEDDA